MKQILLSLSCVVLLVGCMSTTPSQQRICQVEAAAYTEYQWQVANGYVPDQLEIARMVDMALRLVFNCDWTAEQSQVSNSRSVTTNFGVFGEFPNAVKLPVDKYGVPRIVE